MPVLGHAHRRGRWRAHKSDGSHDPAGSQPPFASRHYCLFQPMPSAIFSDSVRAAMAFPVMLDGGIMYPACGGIIPHCPRICDARHLIFECTALIPLREHYDHLFSEPDQTMLGFMWQDDVHSVIRFVTASLLLLVLPVTEDLPNQP